MSVPVIIGMVNLYPVNFTKNLHPNVLNVSNESIEYVSMIYNNSVLKPVTLLANLVPRIVSVEGE